MTALVARFRRVLVVDALVWSGRIDDIRTAEALAGRDLTDVEPALDGLWSLHVRTTDGRLVVPPGWRLMYGPDGEPDAVPGDVFAANYRPDTPRDGHTGACGATTPTDAPRDPEAATGPHTATQGLDATHAPTHPRANGDSS